MLFSAMPPKKKSPAMSKDDYDEIYAFLKEELELEETDGRKTHEHYYNLVLNNTKWESILPATVKKYVNQIRKNPTDERTALQTANRDLKKGNIFK
jgi:hypothetical protein